jgi:hypothetical protein
MEEASEPAERQAVRRPMTDTAAPDQKAALPGEAPPAVDARPGPSGRLERLRSVLGGAREGYVVAAGLVALTALSLALRLEGQGTWLWTDEGISVGIAGHRLADIPVVLRKDGSPPFYYLLLHGWMRVVGRSEVQTHALSLAFALLTVPVGFWAGRSLFGRRAGWIAAALAATAPYLSEFSHETRMYTLVALLALIVTTLFAHAFVLRRRRAVPLFAASLLVLLYTHNWGLYVAGATLLALVPCVLRARQDKAVVRDAALAFGAVALLYLPWVPTLLEQLRHTGAPWSPRPVVREIVSAVGIVLGDTTERVLVALVLGGGLAAWNLIRRWRSPEGTTLLVALLIGGVTLTAAWIGAQAKPAWSDRYLAALFGPVLIIAAATLARGGAQGLLALALVLVIWTEPVGRLTGLRHPVTRDAKSAVKPVADAVGPELHGGDLVIAVQMEEVPVLHYYLPGFVRFADVTGPVADPSIVDWRDALTRVRDSTVAADLAPLVDALPPGGRLLLVCTGDQTSPRTIPWFRLMDERCDQWQAALEADARIEAVAVPRLDALAPSMSRAVRLFEKRA